MYGNDECFDVDISIHGSREGPDSCLQRFLLSSHISIHGSREGPDLREGYAILERDKFQSTGPVRDPTSRASMS